MARILFLPGASASASFWKPAAERAGLSGTFYAWPGLGDEPPRADISCIDDLVAMVAADITGPVAIVAQSMGGVIAVRLALAFPVLVERLVLVATSGGLPVAELGGADWRANYRAAYPQAASWISEPVPDLTDLIPSITAPTLLLWGDADPISPVAVGQRLASLLPHVRLAIIAGADHDLALTHVDTVAAELSGHLTSAGKRHV